MGDFQKHLELVKEKIRATIMLITTSRVQWWVIWAQRLLSNW